MVLKQNVSRKVKFRQKWKLWRLKERQKEIERDRKRERERERERETERERERAAKPSLWFKINRKEFEELTRDI